MTIHGGFLCPRNFIHTKPRNHLESTACKAVSFLCKEFPDFIFSCWNQSVAVVFVKGTWNQCWHILHSSPVGRKSIWLFKKPWPEAEGWSRLLSWEASPCHHAQPVTLSPACSTGHTESWETIYPLWAFCPCPFSKTKTDNCPELWMDFSRYVTWFGRKAWDHRTVSPPIGGWARTVIPKDETHAELWPSIYKSFFKRTEKKFKHIFGVIWMGRIFHACFLRINENSMLRIFWVWGRKAHEVCRLYFTLSLGVWISFLHRRI